MKQYSIGLDVGSTTIKTAVLDKNDTLVYSSYERHYSDIKATLAKVLKTVLSKYDDFSISVTYPSRNGWTFRLSRKLLQAWKR